MRSNTTPYSRDEYFSDHYLLALDGTTYHASQEVHCASCLERHHRNGTVTYSHQSLGVVLLHPDRRDFMSED
jgi:hypothetical protein